MRTCCAWAILFLAPVAALSSKPNGPFMSAATDNSSNRMIVAPSNAGAVRRVLFDVPVSNHAARCRIIIYKKGIPSSEIAISSPSELGGLRTQEYLAVNPQGKTPALTVISTPSGQQEENDDGAENCRARAILNLSESDTISRYLLSEYAHLGPSFQPNNPIANLVARIHDIYLSPIQGAMYKAAPPFGPYGNRKEALTEYRRQVDIIENLVHPEGPYLCGVEVSLADATLFPSAVFVNRMLPKFFDGHERPALPPKLARWFDHLQKHDSAFQRVFDEIEGGLATWHERKRWDTIHGAGLQDEGPPTIFDKILSRQIPAQIVREDNYVMAFKDINPAAPAHVLIIPKERNGLTQLSKATAEHKDLLGHMLVVAAEISNDSSLGFVDGSSRIVINNGPWAGQEVMHLHVHVLGGRTMQWPPG